MHSRQSAVPVAGGVEDWLYGQPNAIPGPNETISGENDNDNDQGFTTRLYSLCLRLLRYICQQEENISSKRNRVSSLKEELGRLYLWGEAFRNGKLDRALEYSDDVRGNVLDSLRDIAKPLLRELRPSPTSVPPPISLQKSIQELKSLVEQTKVIISTRNIAAAPNGSDWADDSDTDQDDSSDDDDTTTIAEELRLQIRWLTQLGPLLEQNLVSAQRARMQASPPELVSFSVSGPAKIYVSLVREKYKQAPNQLVERLGEANWQRHISVRNSMKASTNVAEEISAPVEDLAVSRSLFRPYSRFHDSGIGSSIPAQTEYAPSHTSFQSSNTEGGRELIRVPATPVEVDDGKPFQCFLCKRVLSNIKNRVDWKVHIFADLQPYICTFADCEDELAQFPNRAAWAEHEFSQHRITQSWSCPECPQAFTSISGWQSHIQHRHCLVFSGPNLNVAKDMAYKTEATRVEDAECPLCRTVVGKPRRAFVKHVARHMEEIALMALPRNVEDDSEEGSVSTDRTSPEGSRTNFHAKPCLEADEIAEEAEARSGTTSPYLHTASYQPYPQGLNARRFSIASSTSRNSLNNPESNDYNLDDNGKERTRCPYPDCGRPFKDLKAHMLTHQSERPEKCPITTCAYHQKGFARKYDKNRHTLTHYKGIMVCGFCPGSGSASGKSFNRADVFKRHLTSVHGVEQMPPNSRKKSTSSSINKKMSTQAVDAIGKCSTCSAMFKNAQDFYEHLDDCVLRVVQQEEPSEAINEQHLRGVANEEDMPDDKRPRVAKTMGSSSAGDPSSGSNYVLNDYQTQMMLLEDQNKKRLLMTPQERATASIEIPSSKGDHALQDYRMHMMLLEDQNKKRGWIARQEPDTMSDSQDQGLRRDDLGLHKLAQPNPVKKNVNLGEYFSRRKGSQPGSAGAATGPKLSDLP